MAALAPLRVVGPPPSAPRYGLTTTPGTIVDQADPHFLGGVLVDSYPDDLPLTHNPCAAGTSRVKEEGTDPPMPEFSSFTVYLPVSCSGLGIGDEAGYELLRRRAQVVFAARESGAVEKEFMFGTVDGDRPSLNDVTAPNQLNGGAATGPREALALLEREIGETYQQGFVHLDPATFVAMDAFSLFHDEGGRKVTNRGNTVIIGDGYIGGEPKTNPVLTDDQNWAFATGPVAVSRDEISLPPLRSIFNETDNSLTIRAERNYVAYWDTSLLRGVLVDRSSTP